jgi:hypothetical protein
MLRNVCGSLEIEWQSEIFREMIERSARQNRELHLRARERIRCAADRAVAAGNEDASRATLNCAPNFTREHRRPNVVNLEAADVLERRARCFCTSCARVDEGRNHFRANRTRSVPPAVLPREVFYAVAICRMRVTTPSNARSSNGFCITVQRVRCTNSAASRDATSPVEKINRSSNSGATAAT